MLRVVDKRIKLSNERLMGSTDCTIVPCDYPDYPGRSGKEVINLIKKNNIIFLAKEKTMNLGELAMKKGCFNLPL